MTVPGLASSSPPPNYFTCTLAEALAFNLSRGAQVRETQGGSIVEHEQYANLNGFLDFLASRHGDRWAIGCVQPNRVAQPDDEPQIERLTFRRMRNLAKLAGSCLRSLVPASEVQSDWVALLSSSSIVFAIVWLALVRAGFQVLLIAPQSSPDATRNLLRQCKARAIFHDGAHVNLAHAATGVNDASPWEDSAACVLIPWATLDDLRLQFDESQEEFPDIKDDHQPLSIDDAYAFHSSGTTGLPKLIPQTHHGAVGVLPLLQDSWDSQTSVPATFTTTPLYHGGIADLLRCWSAAATIFIFAENVAPITRNTVLSCIRGIRSLSADSCHLTQWHLAYFSCVPFILEALAGSNDALRVLQEFSMVGVGGASMPQELGDDLVHQGVKLVSRFGSSECGFLLSSHRDFDTDNHWQSLSVPHPRYLRFQKVADGDQLELIVPSAWPLVSAAKHARRPFSTKDLFLSVQDGTYTYKGRSDAQIALKTGKKFDPLPLEAKLRRVANVEEAVIIGEGRHAPGLLLFVSSAIASETDIIPLAMWAAIESVNEQSPIHARLDRQNVCLLHHKELGRLRKNNKGGIVRSSLEADFKKEIDCLYSDDAARHEEAPLGTDGKALSKECIIDIIKSCVNEQLGPGNEIGLNDDFFESGLDSAGCIAVCRRLSRTLNIKGLSLNVAYDCGSISALTEHVLCMITNINGSALPEMTSMHSITNSMRNLVELQVQQHLDQLNCAQSCNHSDAGTKNDSRTGLVVLMTGATGLLGVHLLQVLLQDPNVSRIHTLVRGSRHVSYQEQQERAEARVTAALNFHCMLKGFDMSCVCEKVRFVPYLYSDNHFGLPACIYQSLVENVTHIMHAAWEVNFGLPLKSFSSHVQGAVNLFHLGLHASAMNREISYVFCSSIASIENAGEGLNYTTSSDPLDSSQIGYAQSKWVAENVLQRLSQLHPQINTRILRIGQLSGDTITGIWNPREAWPLMLDASLCLDKQECQLPDLANTAVPAIDWLPVDLAARQVVKFLDTSGDHYSLKVSPVSNAEQRVSWSYAQSWIAAWARERGYIFKALPVDVWLERLEADAEPHQAKALIPLWRNSWKPLVETVPTAAKSIESDGTAPINETYMRRVLDWIAKSHQTR